MTKAIYFQWQNETLLKTIYPKRREKLIDFLVHFEEIELWKNNEKMPKAELEKWRKKFETKQARVLVELLKTFDKQRKYFLEDDGLAEYRKKYPDLKEGQGEDELERVRKLHETFQILKTDLYNGDARKEKIFVGQRILTWEEYRKKVNDRVFWQRRRVNSIRENIREAEKSGSKKLKNEFLAMAAAEEAELTRLESQLLPMVDEEMARLTALASAYGRYEKRKAAVKKAREKLRAELDEKLAVFNKKWREVRLAEDELRSVQGWLGRFKNAPELDAAEKNLFSDVDWEGLGQVFGIETKLLDRFRGIREYLIGLLKMTQGADVKLTFVSRMLENVAALKNDIDGKIGRLQAAGGRQAEVAILQVILSQVLQPELERLADYQFALDRTVRKDEGLARDLVSKQAREAELLKSLKAGRAGLADLQAAIAPLSARLDVPEEEELVKYEPEKEITVNDIVVDMANVYRESLAKKTHAELLEAVVQLFWDQPERFPLWLQYMVIHFSGMRYASAHGSWADPKELLLNLRASQREDENRALMDVDEIVTQSEAWLRYLESDGDPAEVEGEAAFTLPLSKLREDDDEGASTGGAKRRKKDDDRPKIAGFIADLQSENILYTRRKALHNLKTLQDKYEVEAMTPQDVLEALKDIHERENLPDWMWSEIVAMTDLRIEEAKSPGWEKLTPEQEVDKNSGRWDKYRAIMNKWKAENLVDWRKEHEETGQLVVTRAVCNEVAEHIQHMRGHEGAAGLTEKPNWYRREERDFDEQWPRWTGERPYFKRPRLDTDFKEGASLLWLRYVRDFPNEWRIAQPLETEEKDGLIRAEYLGKRAPGNWVYSMEDGIPRRRTVERDGVARREVQYLRWMHEATVAAVAATAEGTVVLTFETALPYEDRRLSTIGVFKRYPRDLKDDFGEDGYNPAFVGFVPEAEIPAEHFRHMLDWNKVLLREFKPQAELEAWQERNIRRRSLLPQDVKSDHISLTDRSEAQRAAGWVPVDKKNLYRALDWGVEPLVTQGRLTAKIQGPNFNPLPIFSDSGTWSALSNALRIPREDVDRLIGMQVEGEDGFTLREKMNWLVYPEDYERPYWCKGRGDWRNASEIIWGTILFGGELVLADGEEVFRTDFPGQKNMMQDVPMKRLVCFTKFDWDKTHDTHPWLVQRGTEVNQNDRPNRTPRGLIYSPLWSPQHWDFTGGKQPQAFYIPSGWLEPFHKGLAADFVGGVLALRRKAGLKSVDRVELFIEASPELKSAIEAYEEFVAQETLASSFVYRAPPEGMAAFEDAFYGETVRAGLVKK